MAAAELELSFALSDNVRTRPLLAGAVRPQGVRPIVTAIHPSEMFWRQLHFGDFDVSEMSIASLLIAQSQGMTQWVALPVFTMRRFFHTSILVRAAAGIDTPGDLAGKRVGVPEYQQTSAVWCRGVLEHEFGVPPSRIRWFMERGPDRSHGRATGFSPPAGIELEQIPPSTDIGKMLLAGELDATLLYLNDSNLVDRSRADVSAVPAIKPLFSDPVAEGARYYAKTGIYPINHAVVVRRTLLDRHPWLALNLYSAFLAAKAQAEEAGRLALGPYVETGLMSGVAMPSAAGDPMPYGFKAAYRVLETIGRYLYEQGLTVRAVDVETVFARQTLEL